MSHNSYKIFKDATSGQGITIPDDICPVLGINTNDIGAACTSAAVNKWSKYRPMEHTSPLELTEAQRRAANWGWTIPAFNSLGAMLTACNSNAGSWAYSIPHTWFRLLDFDGYNHTCSNPFRYELNKEDAIKAERINVQSVGLQSQENMTKADFDNIKNLKLSIALKDNHSGDVYTLTEDNAEENFGFRMTNIVGQSDKDYTVYFFWTNLSFSLLTPTPLSTSGTFIPCPCERVYLSIFAGTGYNFRASNIVVESTNTHINFRLSVLSSSSTPIKNLQIRYWRTDGQVNQIKDTYTCPEWSRLTGSSTWDNIRLNTDNAGANWQTVGKIDVTYQMGSEWYTQDVTTYIRPVHPEQPIIPDDGGFIG